MYIAPNTNVKILKNVRLDSSYRNTVYWSTIGDQTAYFASKAKYSLTEYSYQRVEKAIRVGIKAESLFDCSYLMFQNASFGDKWFYAFITGVRYINNTTSEIDFVLDLLQTWYFDFTFEQCFIERQHSVTDNIGDNTLAEPVPLGDYLYYHEGGTGHLTNWVILINSTLKSNGTDSAGNTYGRIYQGAGFIYSVSPQAVNGFINDLLSTLEIANVGSVIVNMCMYPLDLLGVPMFDDNQLHDLNSSGALQPIPVSYAKRETSIGSYVPKNKKLFTYPYNFLRVTDYTGNYQDYHYEFFSTANCTFNLTGSITAEPEILITPNAYKDLSVDYDESVKLSKLPICSYATDTYGAYLAMNGAKNDMGKTLSVLKGTFGFMSGNTKMIMGGLDEFTSISIGENVASKMSDEIHGTASSDVLYGLNEKDFHFINVHVKEEYARIIDDFFTKYGYSQKRLAVPNPHARQNFTYIKTVGASIHGNMPASAIESIEKILDNGITYWVNADSIGDYSLSNNPLGGS